MSSPEYNPGHAESTTPPTPPAVRLAVAGLLVVALVVGWFLWATSPALAAPGGRGCENASTTGLANGKGLAKHCDAPPVPVPTYTVMTQSKIGTANPVSLGAPCDAGDLVASYTATSGIPGAVTFSDHETTGPGQVVLTATPTSVEAFGGASSTIVTLVVTCNDSADPLRAEAA